MPVFEQDKPQDTDKPAIDVENKLKAGVYRFQLIVEDSDGLQSDPVFTTVTVRDRPVAVLNAPKVVQAGQAFALSGDGSTDPGGQITKYHFTLVANDGTPIIPTSPNQ